MSYTNSVMISDVKIRDSINYLRIRSREWRDVTVHYPVTDQYV